jgi:hypothetical protein
MGFEYYKPKPVANHDTPNTRKLAALALEHGFKLSDTKSRLVRGDRYVVFGAKRTTFWTGDYDDFKHYETETDFDKILSEELDVDPFADEHTGGNLDVSNL